MKEPKPPRVISVPNALWDNIDVRGPNDCWPWTGRRDSSEYGLVGNLRVTRVLLGLTKGDGLVARHRCDNPPCCNPAHLEPGTRKDNMDDMWSRNRGPRGEQRAHAKLTALAVQAIRQDPRSSAVIAQEFGVSGDLITKVKRGERWLHVPIVGSPCLPTRCRHHELSARQAAILVLVAENLSNREIGLRLGIGTGTVATQISRMFRKLGAKDRAHAVDLGWRAGVLR